MFLFVPAVKPGFGCPSPWVQGGADQERCDAVSQLRFWAIPRPLQAVVPRRPPSGHPQPGSARGLSRSRAHCPWCPSRVTSDGSRRQTPEAGSVRRGSRLARRSLFYPTRDPLPTGSGRSGCNRDQVNPGSRFRHDLSIGYWNWRPHSNACPAAWRFPWAPLTLTTTGSQSIRSAFRRCSRSSLTGRLRFPSGATV